jgi:hypothetical protein
MFPCTTCSMNATRGVVHHHHRQRQNPLQKPHRQYTCSAINFSQNCTEIVKWQILSENVHATALWVSQAQARLSRACAWMWLMGRKPPNHVQRLPPGGLAHWGPIEAFQPWTENMKKRRCALQQHRSSHTALLSMCPRGTHSGDVEMNAEKKARTSWLARRWGR